MQYYNDKTVLYLNGSLVTATAANTDLYSQSLHYGFAAYESIRSYNTHNGTRIFKARAHFERLKNSCELINLPFEWDINELIKQTYQLLTVNKLKDAHIRPLVYCEPNMSFSSPSKASIVISAWEFAPDLGDSQLNMAISSFQCPNPNSVPVLAKITAKELSAVLAHTEAKKRGFDEAIMLDINQNIAESPGANIFIEKNGKLYTPPVGYILPGITRSTIMQLCRRLDIDCIEKVLTVEDLTLGDSAFLCGTAVEIAGIFAIEEIVLPLKWQDSLGATLQRTYKSLVLEKQNYEVII